MNLIEKVFSKTPSAKDIHMQLKELEREQTRKRRDLEMVAQAKEEKVRQAVAAKKAGRQELLRDIYRELRQIEIDNGYINSDLRRLSLARTALGSFLRRLETLERSKNRKSVQNLITRFKNSSIQKAIDTAAVDDDTFNDMLEEILGEEEIAATEVKVKEDAGFAAFDRAIEEMAKAEEAGAGEEVLSKLRTRAGRLAATSPDNYPSYGNKVASPDNYPSYGNKVASITDMDREPMFSSHQGLKEAEGPKPSPSPSPDPCRDSCVGGSASYSKIHG